MKTSIFSKTTIKAISTSAAALCLSLAAVDSLAAKKFYKWVDDQGVVHYSATPPKGQKSSVVTTYNRRGTPAPNQTKAAAKEEANSKAAASQETRQRIKDPKLCASAKKNLEVIETNHRIRLRGDDGQMRILSEAEKESQRKNSEQIVTDHCE